MSLSMYGTNEILLELIRRYPDPNPTRVTCTYAEPVHMCTVPIGRNHVGTVIIHTDSLIELIKTQ